jgi:nucleoside-diphosphate-sugar epimerase
MARTLVTGSTGFIGRHVVQRLRERGNQVRCLVRRLPDGPGDGSLEYVLGDLTRPETLDAAVRGIDRVYHAAGATLVLSTKTYARINDAGTRHLVEACARRSSPPTIIHISSLAAAGPTDPEHPRVEAQPEKPVSAYGRSKLAAEHHLKRFADQVPVTVLRPPAVFGPWDPNMLRLFQTVRRGFNFVPGRSDKRLSLLYVEDLVTAMLLAAERGRRLATDREGPAAERGIYFLAIDQYPTLAELGREAAAALGVTSVWTVRLPLPLCWLFAFVAQTIARVRGKPALFIPDKMREATAGSWICSSHKAKTEIGFTCATTLAEGFRLTADWYLRHGWL